MDVDFGFAVPGALHSGDYVGLQRLPFFDEFLDAFRVGIGNL